MRSVRPADILKNKFTSGACRTNNVKYPFMYSWSIDFRAIKGRQHYGYIANDFSDTVNLAFIEKKACL